MTKAQEKKAKNNYLDMKADDLGDLWKSYRDRKLTPDELVHFNLVREVYKEKTGNSLLKNTYDEKGK